MATAPLSPPNCTSPVAGNQQDDSPKNAYTRKYQPAHLLRGKLHSRNTFVIPQHNSVRREFEREEEGGGGGCTIIIRTASVPMLQLSDVHKWLGTGLYTVVKDAYVSVQHDVQTGHRSQTLGGHDVRFSNNQHDPDLMPD